MTKSQKRQRRKKKKKRRFEAASALVLGRARAKRSFKSSGWSRLLLLRGVLLLLVVVVVGALWLWLDDRFYVHDVDVVGATRVSPHEVFQASGLQRLHVLWARSAEIEARILAELPTIESAQVACGVSGECVITVVERQPRMVWDEGGHLWWVDVDGVIFPAPPSLPPIEGDEGGTKAWMVQGPLPRDEDGRLDERVCVALNELWAAEVNVSSLLDYVPGPGLVFTDERGWRVVVGQGPGMDERLRVLELLAADLEARGLTPRYVDVRFPDAPYYSLTNDW